MKKLSIHLISLAAAMAFFAAPAAADEVACPVDQVRTEITTTLPDPWWQTPQVGSLQDTRVGEVGGETTLICEYWAYGTTVSVMRHPPENMVNCTAHEGGFTCQRQLIATPLPIPIPLPGGVLSPEPAESPSAVYRAGSLSIPQTWQADFDSGQVGEGTADIWFHAVTATERYIEPRNGAQIGIYAGGTGMSEEQCAATPKSSNRIPIASAPEGSRICYVTSDGRQGFFRVLQPVGESPGTLQVHYRTWE
jgi:hypothetical protein